MIAKKQLAITLFGSMEIRVDGQPIPRLRTRKGYWLFGLLVLKHGAEIRREWLAGTLWPESRESQARANLNLSVTDLRKALGSQAFRLQSVTMSTLRLDLSEAECDLITFDALSSGKDRADRERAVACYRGALLEDCYESWISIERERREQTYVQLLENLAEEAGDRRDWRTAVYYLRTVVKHDPYRESALLQLMQALTQIGDPNAALRAYQEFARFLRQDDVRAHPSQEIEHLYQQIRFEAHQLLKPHVSRSLAPILARKGASVPARITQLIGREQQISQVASVLKRSRLVTLTGAGGVGKTSLALVLAAEEADAYPHSAVFIALDVLTDPTEIPGRILSALGVTPDSKSPPAEALAQFLANKGILLVLDNMEHLLTAGAAQIQDLLRRCPALAILVTSRQPLGIPDEVSWRVPSLSVPDLRQLPIDDVALLHLAKHSDAVRLFVERAVARQADFQLNALNSRAIIEICSRLDGIPFAIELAAACVVALPVSEIARRLDNCYRVLTEVNPAAVPRHQTLTALMNWSYNLLNQAERTLLPRLSVFMGGFTLEAAEAVCTDSALEQGRILGLLTSLINKSMVVYQENDGTARYRLLETVKQYSAERLQEDQDPSVLQDRHALYFLAFAQRQEARLSSAEQVIALDLLDAENDNFEAALRWSACSPDTLEIACRLAGALWYVWNARGQFLRGLRWLDELAPRADTVPEKVRGMLLLGAAYLAYLQGDAIKHAAYSDTALELFNALSDRLWYAKSLVMKSRNRDLSGTEALALLRESLEIFRVENDSEGVAEALCQMGTKESGEPDPAIRIAWFDEGIRIHRKRQDYRNIAIMAGELGYATLRSGGNRENFRALFEEMLALGIQLNDRGIQAHALWLMGYAAAYAADYSQARRYYTGALDLSRLCGAKHGLALILTSFAKAESQLGQMKTARILAEEGLALYRDLDYTRCIQETMQLLAHFDTYATDN